MEEVMEHSGMELADMAKDCAPHGMKHVALELFSDGVTLSRIAFFIAFAKKVAEQNPHCEMEIYKDVFKSLYNGIKV